MDDSALLRQAGLASQPDEIEQFLDSNNRSYLFVRTRDGEVRGWPLSAFHGRGVLCYTTYRRAPKVPHLLAATTATALVVTPEGRDPLRYVEVSGRLRIVEFTPKVIECFLALPAHDHHKVTAAVTRRFRDRLASGKRVLVELEIEQARIGMLDSTGATA